MTDQVSVVQTYPQGQHAPQKSERKNMRGAVSREARIFIYQTPETDFFQQSRHNHCR